MKYWAKVSRRLSDDVKRKRELLKPKDTKPLSRTQRRQRTRKNKTFETRRHEAANADTKNTKKKDTETQRHHAASAAHKGDTEIF
jgi:hypothetical protein